MGVNISCKKCGSVYELTFMKVPFRDQESIKCKVCDEVLHRWSEAKVWEAKLIEKHQDHIEHHQGTGWN